MSTSVAWPEDAFWTYSLALYGRRDVERACLDLQQRHDLDINLLLLCCWLASRGIELDPAGLAGALAAVRSWQLEVVRPLRAIRRRLKIRLAQPEAGAAQELWPDQTGRLRAGILALELDAEHLEQLTLSRAVTGCSMRATPSLELAARNLRHYWRFRTDDRAALERLLGAAFPDATETDVSTAAGTVTRRSVATR